MVSRIKLTLLNSVKKEENEYTANPYILVDNFYIHNLLIIQQIIINESCKIISKYIKLYNIFHNNYYIFIFIIINE